MWPAGDRCKCEWGGWVWVGMGMSWRHPQCRLPLTLPSAIAAACLPSSPPPALPPALQQGHNLHASPAISQDHNLGFPLAVLTGHGGGVTAVRFSPVLPHVLLTSSDDGSCRIWSTLRDSEGGRPAPAIVLRPGPSFGVAACTATRTADLGAREEAERADLPAGPINGAAGSQQVSGLVGEWVSG